MTLHISYQQMLYVLAGLVLLLPFLKKFLWWAFGFDAKVKKLLSQAKSADVRYGKLNETLAPLVENFPVDIKKPGTSTLFIGQPIDYIHFDPDDGVVFIEVKSANSKLSTSQRKLRKLIEEGQVEWAEVRLD